MGRSHKFGLAFGYSQFIQYGVFGALYFFGALFVKEYGPVVEIDPATLQPVDPEKAKEAAEFATNIWISIFCMMFAAFQSG